MDVSIIIVNYNTCQLTRNCVDSIFEKTKNLSFEIILVDNASVDGSKEVFEQDNRIKYIYSKVNLGFGGGNNLGYKYADGDYIFLLNSDTLLINNAIYELVNFMKKHTDVGIAGGALYNLEMQPCHSYGELLPSLKSELNHLFRNLFVKKIKKNICKEVNSIGYASVGYITGADMILRREIIDQIGLFDTDFFMYFEETEMTFRYLKNGIKSFYYPKAKIQHLEGKSFTFKEAREQVYLESRKLYFRKVGFSKFYYQICTIIYVIYLYTSLAKYILSRNSQGTKDTLSKIRISLKYIK